MPHFYMGHTPVVTAASHTCGDAISMNVSRTPEAPLEPPPKRTRVQHDRFDEDLFDRACAIVDSMSTVEKDRLSTYLGDRRNVPQPNVPAPQDPERCIYELFSQWVDVKTMDANDATTVAETLCDTLAKVLPSDALLPKLAVDMLELVLKRNKCGCVAAAQQLLAIPCVQDEVVKPPAHLQPDDISNLPDHHPEKIKKWRDLNKEMVRRIVGLQTTDTRKFWLREGVKPIAASSNERDVFFDMVRIVRLQCPKPELKEFLTWFKSQVPAKFRKQQANAGGCVGDKHGNYMQPVPQPTLEPKPNEEGQRSDDPPSANPPPGTQRNFDIATYNLEMFAKDALSLKPLSSESSTLVSVKDIGKTIKFDTDSSPELTHAIAQFDHALESFGMSKPVRDDVYQHLKAATLTLGLRCNKTQVEDLRRWIARSLALKYKSE